MRRYGFAAGLAHMMRTDSGGDSDGAAWREEATTVLRSVGRKAGYRMDANETAAFVRQLEFRKAQTYDIRYPNLRMKEWVPVDTSVPTGAEYFTWRAYDLTGMAKIVANYGQDLPTVGLIGGEVSVKIRSIAAAYRYSIQDVRAAEFGSTGLDAKRPQAARRVIENALDMIGAMGVPAAGLPGFFTNPNVPILSAPGSLNGSWATATPQQILDDLNALSTFVVTNSKTVHSPDAMLVPVSSFQIISTRVYNPLSGATVKEVFLKNSPYIRSIDQSLYLESAANGGGISLTMNGPPSAPAGGGAGGVARFVAYTKDPECLGYVIPQMFEQFPPETDGLEFQIPCHARCAGTTYYLPLSAAYGDGI